MRKQILFIASLLLILGVCSLQTINKSLAQSEANTQTSDFPRQNQSSEIPESVAYRQLFRMINSFEREAQKQASQGFAGRAETLRNTFRKKLQLDDELFNKLKEASSNFSDEVSRLKSKAKKLNNSKISKAKKTGEMEKIENENNQLPLMYRENLRKVFGDKDFERFAESLREKIAAKMIYRLDAESKPSFIGYSTIDYDPASGEIMGYSATPNDGTDCDWEEGHSCVGTWVEATLSSDAEGNLDTESSETCNSDAEVFLYSSGSLPGVEYCVDGDHVYDDGSFCSFQGGGISSTSEDCLVTPLPPNVTSVDFQTIAPNNEPIDEINGGLRIFPDDNTPMENANRQTIQVTAGISEPVAGRTVYFRNFDVDDPSDDTTIDPNGTAGDDNNGRVNGLREGQLSAVSATTNSNGIATVNFTVTMQPGDNFAIAASTDPNQINSVSVSGTGLLNGQGQSIDTRCDYTELVCRSEMLTVWRRLHIEVDSMGVAQGNFVVGNFIESARIGAFNTEVLVSNSDLEINRFENGRLVSGSRSFRIVSNSDNSVTIRVLNGGAARINEGEIFTLYDDDDFNDSGTLDGDTGEDIPEPDTNLLTANSDDSATNVFAPAYVRPVYDVVDPRDNNYFQANTFGDFETDLRPLFVDWDSASTNTGAIANKFWTVSSRTQRWYIISRNGKNQKT
ncbi:MAG: hypothetical protein ACR2HG_00525 [Pyrinomonadaceae bacterium]